MKPHELIQRQVAGCPYTCSLLFMSHHSKQCSSVMRSSGMSRKHHVQRMLTGGRKVRC